MTELFQTTKQNVSLHIAEGELERTATVKEYLTVQQEGKRQVSRNIEYFNLDVIIIKEFALDDERRKQAGGDTFGKVS